MKKIILTVLVGFTMLISIYPQTFEGGFFYQGASQDKNPTIGGGLDIGIGWEYLELLAGVSFSDRFLGNGTWSGSNEFYHSDWYMDSFELSPHFKAQVMFLNHHVGIGGQVNYDFLWDSEYTIEDESSYGGLNYGPQITLDFFMFRAEIGYVWNLKGNSKLTYTIGMHFAYDPKVRYYKNEPKKVNTKNATYYTSNSKVDAAIKTEELGYDYFLILDSKTEKDFFANKNIAFTYNTTTIIFKPVNIDDIGEDEVYYRVSDYLKYIYDVKDYRSYRGR